MDELSALVHETRRRVTRALEALSAGADPDEAVLTSGLLVLFDDGEDPGPGDGLGPLPPGTPHGAPGGPPGGDGAAGTPPWAIEWLGPVPAELEAQLEARLFAGPTEHGTGLDAMWGCYHALAEMLGACQRYEAEHRNGVQLTFELVSWYHELLTHAPNALWRYRLRLWLAERLAGSPELAEARYLAVERLGSAHRLEAAIEAWTPELEERRRLQAMMQAGREVEAITQALEQAVFHAELDETWL